MADSGVIVVFDFDKTIIDCDSDNWVVDSLGATALFDELLQTIPWNSAMDTVMGELHKQGRSIEDVSDLLRKAPIDHHVISAIRSAHAIGCELRIVSDANRFFIDTVLEHHGLAAFFSEVHTNPGRVDVGGRLRISPHCDSHSCPLCPPNMCKGLVVDRIRAEVEGKRRRIVYLGDGKGDYCPSLRLTELDCVMPRKHFPLWDLVRADPALLKAEVREWVYGEEQASELQSAIADRLRKLPLATDIVVVPADCKMESAPLPPPQRLPKILLPAV